MKHSNGRLFIGLILIVIGSAFIIKNMDLVPWHIEYYYLSWPTYIFLVGFVITLASRGSFFGLSVMIVGGIFIFGRVYDYSTGDIFESIWPIFIILFGISIIFKHRSQKENDVKVENGWQDYAQDSIDLTTLFGDNKRKIVSQSFVGAKIFTLFGSTKLDFHGARLERSCTINADTIFGGTEIYVPSDWKVVNKTTAIFGGTDDQRRKSAPIEKENEHILTVDGFCMFGGIEIKS